MQGTECIHPFHRSGRSAPAILVEWNPSLKMADILLGVKGRSKVFKYEMVRCLCRDLVAGMHREAVAQVCRDHGIHSLTISTCWGGKDATADSPAPGAVLMSRTFCHDGTSSDRVDLHLEHALSEADGILHAAVGTSTAQDANPCDRTLILSDDTDRWSFALLNRWLK